MSTLALERWALILLIGFVAGLSGILLVHLVFGTILTGAMFVAVLILSVVTVWVLADKFLPQA